MAAPARPRLGELLIRANLISEPQLKTALAEQAKWGGKIGEILVRMSYVSEDMVMKALSRQLGIAKVELEQYGELPRAIVARIPVGTARDCQAIAFQTEPDGKGLHVAMADPTDLKRLDELRSVTRGARIIPYFCGPSSIARAIARFYDGEESLDDADAGFKMVDHQGRTLVKSVDQLEKEAKAARAAAPRPAAGRPSASPVAAAPAPVAPTPAPRAAPTTGSASETLVRLEEQQQRELGAMKALVELLIEKGVFSRDEYLARMRR